VKKKTAVIGCDTDGGERAIEEEVENNATGASTQSFTIITGASISKCLAVLLIGRLGQPPLVGERDPRRG
jgi:hypothetical protein